MPTNEAPLTMREAQAYTGLSRDALVRRFDDGRLEGIRIGGQRRFYRESLDRLLAHGDGPARPMADARPLRDFLRRERDRLRAMGE